jgi:serine/threonine protein kinase
MNFNIIKKISSGSFGIVYLIKYNNDYAALKRINLNDLHNNDFRRQLHELNILFYNNSPHLLKGLDLNIYNSQYLEIVTPYYEGGTLENYIMTHKSCNKQINSTIIKNLLINLCMGIKYLHDNDIIHRDLKPANILLDNKTDPKKAVIIDFGISMILEDSKTDLAKTKIGTPYFMSPEQVEINKKYNSKCDVWALGCILYELVTLDKPFKAANIQSLNIKIIKSDYKPIVNTFNDPDIELFKKIINMCLIKSEDLRASIDDILEIGEIKKKVENINNKKIIQAMPCEASFNKVKIFTKCAPISMNKNFYTKTDIINYVTTYKNKDKVILPKIDNIYRPSYVPVKSPSSLGTPRILTKLKEVPILPNNPVILPCGSNVVRCSPAAPCGSNVVRCSPRIIDNKRYPHLFRPSYVPIKSPLINKNYLPKINDENKK